MIRLADDGAMELTQDAGDRLLVWLKSDIESIGASTVVGGYTTDGDDMYQVVAHVSLRDTRALLDWLLDCIHTSEDATL